MTIPEQPDQPGDIDRWLDGLVGRGKADAQTRMLHEALLRRSERQRAVDNTDDAGLERLLFRLRSERLLEASGGKVRWRPTPMWMGIAASFAVVAIILPTLLGTFALLFANAFGAVATAYALTGSSLSIVPILLFAQIRGDVLQDPHLGYALAFGMIVVTGVANAIYIVMRTRAERWLK